MPVERLPETSLRIVEISKGAPKRLRFQTTEGNDACPTNRLKEYKYVINITTLSDKDHKFLGGILILFWELLNIEGTRETTKLTRLTYDS